MVADRQRYEDMEQAVAGAVAAIQQFVDVVAEALKPYIEAIGEVVVQIHTMAWDAYRAAGTPYGDSEEGLRLWIEMLGKAHRAREELLQEHQWNVAMADLRRRIAERQNE